MDAYDAMKSFEFEVFLWRRGSTKVSFDLELAYFSWFEASRWNRNFARSMRQEEIDFLRETCREVGVLDWQEWRVEEGVDPVLIAPWYRAWTIEMHFDTELVEGLDETVLLRAQDYEPDGFIQLTDMVRMICRQDFRVSE